MSDALNCELELFEPLIRNVMCADSPQQESENLCRTLADKAL